MTDRELMQQACAVPLHEQLASVPENARLVIDDADGMGTRFIPVGRMCSEAAAALRERLAQQEPVAWMSPGKERLEFARKDTVYGSHTIPLYTTTQPRQWVGLTDEEIWRYWWDRPEVPDGEDDSMEARFVSAVRAIEAKLREKNT